MSCEDPRRQRRDRHGELKHGVEDHKRRHPRAEDVPRRHGHRQKQLVVARLKKLRLCRKHAADEHERKRDDGVHHEIQPRIRRPGEGLRQHGKQAKEHRAEGNEAVQEQKRVQHLPSGACLLFSAAAASCAGVIRAEGGKARLEQRLKHGARPPIPEIRPPATGHP